MEAELLAAGVLKTSRANVIASALLEFDHIREFNAALARRIQREPIQYIFGEASFYDLSFIVSKAVLIPRPESELLVDETLKILSLLPPGKERTVVDVGTGSGALAIAIAANNRRCHVFATDVSAEALSVAKQNAFRHGVADRITFLQADLIAPLTQRPDVIVANLPYVKSSALLSPQPELRFEPPGALDGGTDGLDVIRRLWLQVTARFQGSGIQLLLEHEDDQADKIQQLVKKPVRQLRDLAGLVRVTVTSV